LKKERQILNRISNFMLSQISPAQLVQFHKISDPHPD